MMKKLRPMWCFDGKTPRFFESTANCQFRSSSQLQLWSLARPSLNDAISAMRVRQLQPRREPIQQHVSSGFPRTPFIETLPSRLCNHCRHLSDQITIKGHEIGENLVARATLLDHGPDGDRTASAEAVVFKVSCSLLLNICRSLELLQLPTERSCVRNVKTMRIKPSTRSRHCLFSNLRAWQELPM